MHGLSMLACMPTACLQACPPPCDASSPKAGRHLPQLLPRSAHLCGALGCPSLLANLRAQRATQRESGRSAAVAAHGCRKQGTEGDVPPPKRWMCNRAVQACRPGATSSTCNCMQNCNSQLRTPRPLPQSCTPPTSTACKVLSQPSALPALLSDNLQATVHTNPVALRHTSAASSAELDTTTLSNE